MKWLGKFAPDFFDVIVLDEGHHNVASTWKQTIEHFPEAKITSFTATLLRADGRKVEGAEDLQISDLRCHTGRIRERHCISTSRTIGSYIHI